VEIFRREGKDGAHSMGDERFEGFDFVFTPHGPALNAGVYQSERLAGTPMGERTKIALNVEATDFRERVMQSFRAERICTERRIRRINVALLEAERKQLHQCCGKQAGEGESAEKEESATFHRV
jgi:hypothetical protein